MENRLGILAMHDPEGNVEDYVLFLLDEVAQYLSHIVIVCSGNMKAESIIKLRQYTDDVFIREDYGYDCGAFKEALTKFIGWDNLRGYDELLLINDSCYGPLFHLEEVFNTMNNKQVDFWGLTEQLEVKSKLSGKVIVPYHIQPYFLVVKNNLFRSEYFRKFWNELELSMGHYDTVINYELKLTDYFHRLGYKSGVYIEGGQFCDNAENGNPHVYFDIYNLVAKHRCPFVKRKAFMFSLDEGTRINSGEIARKTLDYITKKTVYNEKFIWKNLIHYHDITSLYKNLHLNYILSEQVCSSYSDNTKRIAVIIEIDKGKNINDYLERIGSIPLGIPIIVNVWDEKSEEILNIYFETIHRLNYIVSIINKENRQKRITEYKYVLNNYDYLCFINYRAEAIQSMMLNTAIQSAENILWENTLKNDIYINNVINCFEENEQLGILSSQEPYNALYFQGISPSWSECFDGVKKFIEKLNISCKLVEDQPPYFEGRAFWCRTKALKALLKYSYEDEEKDEGRRISKNRYSFREVIKKSLVYVAQYEGYCSGTIMTTEYASIYTVNYQNMLSGIYHNFISKFGVRQYDDIYKVNIMELFDFVKRYHKIYIYGAGEIGHYCLRFVNELYVDFQGFIVSDGERENNDNNEKIYELSEVKLEKNSGIIIALNKENSEQVNPILERKNIKNIINFMK